jgi:hypothetical protein
MSGSDRFDRSRKVGLFRPSPSHRIVCLVWLGAALVSLPLNADAQQRVEGRLEIGDPNVMRGLEGFEIKAFGYLDASRRGTSQVKEAVSDEQGEFKIEVMNQGSIVSAFSPDGRVVGWTWVDPQQADFRLDLVRSAVFSGQVLERETGRPVTGLRVRTVTPVGRDGLLRTSLGTSVTTDVEGRFTLSGILPGIPYWIQIGRQVLDKESPTDAGFQNWFPLQVNQAQEWVLPPMWVRVSEQLEVSLTTVAEAGGDWVLPASEAEFKELLENALASVMESKNRVLVYCRGKNQTRAARLDALIVGLRTLLGERLNVVILDSSQQGAETLPLSFSQQKVEQTWVAMLDSRAKILETVDGRFADPHELFTEFWSQDWLSSPPKANQFLEMIGHSVPDLTLEEALQVVRLLGYASLPALANFQ